MPEGLRAPAKGRGAGLLVTCAAAGDRALDRARQLLGEDAVLVAGRDRVDLPAALDALAGLGLRHVLCEGGPTLFATALAAGVVDELALSLVPTVVGGDGTRITRGGAARRHRRHPAHAPAARGGGGHPDRASGGSRTPDRGALGRVALGGGSGWFLMSREAAVPLASSGRPTRRPLTRGDP